MAESNPFLKAIEVLRERGWHQGDFSGDDGSVCALGALQVATCGRLVGPLSFASQSEADRYQPAETFLMDTVGREVGSRWVDDFNDSPSTSQEDVELLLKKAAQAWEERSCEQ